MWMEGIVRQLLPVKIYHEAYDAYNKKTNIKNLKKHSESTKIIDHNRVNATLAFLIFGKLFLTVIFAVCCFR